MPAAHTPTDDCDTALQLTLARQRLAAARSILEARDRAIQALRRELDEERFESSRMRAELRTLRIALARTQRRLDEAQQLPGLALPQTA